jgi:hydrogenase expression/formation protein HypE
MAGARPLYLSAAFILEEGFPLRDLERIVASTARASRNAGVFTGDTKVVEKGKGDGVFITTTGVGIVPAGMNISGDRASDAILVSGTVGDHGVAVLSKRENLTFETGIVSDSAALSGLVAEMVAAVPALHCLRDPTRGGLAACELLRLDPLYIANEGKLVAICEKADAGRLLDVMRRHPLGHDAALIGEVVADPHAFISMKTRFGGSRMVDWLAGDPLPRIC